MFDMDAPHPTRTRLLNAACRIFAEKGFHDATVAEICSAAKANIAAINYHFGDKSKLYLDAFRHLFDMAHQAHPEPGSEILAPEEWLRKLIRARVAHIFARDESGLLPRLVCREMGQPTPLHDRLYEELFRPRRERQKAVMRAYFGSAISEEALCMAVVNFDSVLIFLNKRHQHLRQIKPHPRDPACLQLDPSALSDQIERFVMGGLEAIRNHLNSSKEQP